MSEKIVVVYGSGASYGSGYKVNINKEEKAPPTDANFFNDVNFEFLRLNCPALHFFITKYFTPYESIFRESKIGMEAVWTALDLNHKHITLGTYDWDSLNKSYWNDPKLNKRYPNMDRERDKDDKKKQYNRYKLLGDCGRDFRRLIFDIYSNLISPPEENLINKLHYKIQDNLLGYITFNYDCCLEDAIANYEYIGSDFGSEAIECFERINKDGKYPILKLHGSLSWKHKKDGIIEEATTYPYDIEIKKKPLSIEPRYTSNDNYSQPLIVAPTVFKQEINDDGRVNDPVSRLMLNQWKGAITLLKKANKIIFVGYSFPDTDFHAKRIFHIAKLAGNDRIKILFCTKANEKELEDYQIKINSIFDITGTKPQPLYITDGFGELFKGDKLDKFLSWQDGMGKS